MFRLLKSDVIAHITGWLMFLSLPAVFIMGQRGDRSFTGIVFSMQYLLLALVCIFIFYFNLYVLVPFFYSGKKMVIYFSTIALLFIAVFLLKPFDRVIAQASRRPPSIEMRAIQHPQHRDIGKGQPHVDIVSIFLFLLAVLTGLAIDGFRKLKQTRLLTAQMETEKVNAELSFLKAQINPHFLFNTLNNIYSLAVTKNEQTADSIMKLSNIMRYVTDEATHDFVSIQEEINCITDYIELQKLRLGHKVSVDYTVKGNPEDKKIAPLILMPFIENVFKYGISNHEPSSLVIRLEITGTRLHFFTENKLFSVLRKAERHGIGLKNTEKRLSHLYPGKHSLTISRGNGLFSVDLFIDISNQ